MILPWLEIILPEELRRRHKENLARLEHLMDGIDEALRFGRNLLVKTTNSRLKQDLKNCYGKQDIGSGILKITIHLIDNIGYDQSNRQQRALSCIWNSLGPRSLTRLIHTCVHG